LKNLQGPDVLKLLIAVDELNIQQLISHIQEYLIIEFGSVIRILRISVGFSGFISVQSGYQFIRIIIRISGYYPLSVGYPTDFRIICITLVTFIVPARIIA